ncbi:MAG TPA: 16S rRNA (cytosine(967)-C(5))-methyltransferase RsmB [Burkholderiales bacterium]|nr:16S rRNA (cytosine(967)-C(5))-methyltransferase RsmB [Burkholderiales bacterium]
MHSLAEALRAAAAAVAEVAAGRSLAGTLERAFEERDRGARGALTDLCYGTLRCYGRVQATVRALSRRDAPDARVEALLWCALYALESGRYAEYTVVDQAVRACRTLGYARAAGYINAVLRARLRSGRSIEARLASDPVACHRHPAWWIARLRTAYPARWQRVLAAGNDRPPMCLRVNARRSSPAPYLARLATQGIAARLLEGSAVLLEHPLPVERLPGFAEGDVSVQDAGAQRAVPLLDLRGGQRVLDACAAPGGKSAHILETADVALTALDVDATRCAAVASTLRRLGLAAEVRAADCCAPQNWWDGKAFDRILADVPCSGSGIARRRPDIKWLRREADIGAYAVRQARILDSLWRLLTPGGKLVYATCSVFPEENGAVVEGFLARTPAARHLDLPGGAAAQLLPDAEHDGFYFALLEKTA